jgi:hypothetical protein
MRLPLLLASFCLAAPALAQGMPQPLPLKDGRYFSGGCDRFNEAGGYIGIGTYRDGPAKGRQYLVPQAERQEGYCLIDKLQPMGAVLAGVAECSSGTRTNPTPMGRYRFNFTVHDAMSFTSLGKRYQWCPSTGR